MRSINAIEIKTNFSQPKSKLFYLVKTQADEISFRIRPEYRAIEDYLFARHLIPVCYPCSILKMSVGG